MRRVMIAAAVMLTMAAPAYAQFGAAFKGAKALKGLSDQEEQDLGKAVSEKVRVRYGVVQDPAVHKYVSLVGTTLAQASSRPSLAWTFIVLDTDGVNAFAAPGGYVHITRGALALIASESELAGVLAHEITHVTERHTLGGIQKGELMSAGADAASGGKGGAISQVAINKTTDLLLNGFGRADELEADEKGIVLANKVGYAPAGLGGFLHRLVDRNKNSTERQGLFASHPEMQERLDKMTRQIASQKLAAAATLEPRYKAAITYKPVPLGSVATVPEGSSGLVGGGSAPAGASADKSGEKKDANAKPAEKPEEKKHGFGLGSLKGVGGGKDENKSAQVTGSGAARGVGNEERNAKGGSNPAPVVVKLTPADIDAFKKEGKLS